MRSPPKDRLFFIRKLLEKSKKYGRHIFVAVLTPTLTGKKKTGRGWQQTERDLDWPALSVWAL